MLVDLPDEILSATSFGPGNEVMSMLMGLTDSRPDGRGLGIERVEVGVYVARTFNFNYLLTGHGIRIDEYPFDREMFDREMTFHDKMEAMRAQMADPTQPNESYGVCDYPTQVVEKFSALTTSPRSFVVACAPVTKAGNPPSGGWRWHKWGEYIGTQEPQCEYIFDEPVIERVYTFSILEILP